MQNRTPGRPKPPAFAPVPRKYRHDGWTPERQRAFIEALADTGSVKSAAHQVNMSPEGAYQLRRQPGAEQFAAAWEAALDHGVRRLEDIAMERALNGVEVPVYSYGKLIGTRIVHNDRLLMFILRNRAVDRFAGSAARKGPDARTRQKLRAEWEAERAVQDQERAAEAVSRVRAELARIRDRLATTRSAEEAEFQAWLKAKREGRAVILPEE